MWAAYIILTFLVATQKQKETGKLILMEHLIQNIQNIV